MIELPDECDYGMCVLVCACVCSCARVCFFDLGLFAIALFAPFKKVLGIVCSNFCFEL